MVAAGGFYEFNLGICEQYILKADKWRALPSHHKDHYCSTKCHLFPSLRVFCFNYFYYTETIKLECLDIGVGAKWRLLPL